MEWVFIAPISFGQPEVVLSICPPGPIADEIADLALTHQFRDLKVT
jgi:hypothetical protein